MSSGEKAAKGKAKAPAKNKPPKGKEASMNDQKFRGDGMRFKCKLVGASDVSSARGDAMCAEAIKKLKVQAIKSHKESGEHKQKIILHVTLKGIRIVDEKTQKLQHEHPINKISFITHDPEDKKIFGYVCSQACTTGHKLYAIKSEKPAGAVTGTLYELFQVVFKLRQEAGLTKKVQNSPQVPEVSNGPSSSSPQTSDGIYEVPFKNGNKKQANPSPNLDHEYAEPVKPSTKNDPHYKVPTSPPLPATPTLQTEKNNREDAKENDKATSADAANSSTILNQLQSSDKDPDQVSQASIPDSPFPTHDNSSADVGFFSHSVFDTATNESGMADTVSVASSADISMLRSGSVSSGSSETRSTHSRTSSFVNQTATNEGVQPGFVTTFDDTSIIGPSLVAKNRQEGSDEISESQNQGDFTVVFPSLGDEEKLEEKEKATVQETSAGNPDPFASSTNEEERTQPVAGEGFFAESFAAFDTAFGDFEVKNGDGNNQEKPDSSSDPFAPSGAAQEKGNGPENPEGFAAFDTAFGDLEVKNSEGVNQDKDDSSNDSFASSGVSQEKANAPENVKGFASETSFEAAFSSEQFTPSQPNTDAIAHGSHSDTDEKPVEEKTQPAKNSAVSLSWGASFEETENVSKPHTKQSAATTQVQFSWTESFASDDVVIAAKSGPSTAASFSWDDAFGGVPAADKESSDLPQGAFSWDDAFGGKTTDGSDAQFVSSPFGNAFTASTVESSSDKPSMPDFKLQPVPQPAVPDKPTSDDSAFTVASSESSMDVLASKESKEIPAPPKDPFEEFKISFPPPTVNPEKTTSNDTADSSESESSNADGELSLAKDSVSNEVPFDENTKEANDLEEMVETLGQLKDHGLEANPRNNTEVEQMKEERPSELQIQESKLSLSERPLSPTAPPPLPPRPVVTAPPLPARPSSLTGTSPMSPHMSTGSPSSISPHQGKKGSAKKTPPPPPPRVDLNEKEALPDPFGSDLFDHQFGDSTGVAEHGNTDWTVSWPSAPELPPKEKVKDLSDPFSDSFFTNFDFPQKPTSSMAINDNVDPFASTDPTSEPFPSAFGNEDLFAAFTPAKVDVGFGGGDPFQNGLSDSFSAFPSDDPFSDVSDPFADRGILSDDPFGDSPSKPQMGESLTLNESLVASDEADSFA